MENKPSYTQMDFGLLLMRLMLATALLYHGSQKLFGAFDGPGLEGFSGWLSSMNVPMPTISAFLAAAAEFFGGIFMLLGVGVRLAAIPAAFTLFVGAFMAHTGYGEREHALLIAVFLTALVLTGGGSLNITAFLARK
ncbi:MAG: DoxD-like family protein [Planctomycetota bacterium]|nr:MAG: DoxD-like family protein [Planctomycetota bacterium]